MPAAEIDGSSVRSRLPWVLNPRLMPWLVLLTVMVLLAAIYSTVFRGEPNGDDLTFHLGEIRRMADCFRAWDFDLWNTSANAGYASAYYYQAVPLIVPAALAALTHTTVLPWFQLCIFLPLVLVPLAGYRGMRLLDASRWSAVSAGAAVAFAISHSKWGHGADGTFTVGLYTQTWAFAALPLALGYAIRWILHGTHLGAAIAWGAFVGMCHPFAGIALGVALVAGLGADVLVRWLAPSMAARMPRWMTSVPLNLHEEAAMTSPGRLGPQLLRIALLGVALLLATAATWLPVLVDYEGFGGFPHRVVGEDGPGLLLLLRWYVQGGILDSGRVQVLTWSLPFVLLLARARYLRWLWGAAFAYAFLMAIGPHLKTQDDLLPAVRFLGSLQIMLALGVGAGLLAVGTTLYTVLNDRFGAVAARAAIGVSAALVVISVFGGGTWVLARRVRVAQEYRAVHRNEMSRVIDALTDESLQRTRGSADPHPHPQGQVDRSTDPAHAPAASGGGGGGGGDRGTDRGTGGVLAPDAIELAEPAPRNRPTGRKQALSGATSHWWNLLPFVYAERPALLQMGGGGLQASPNYDFLWTDRDPARNAWVFDAPYILFERNAGKALASRGKLVVRTKHYEVRQLPSPGLVSPVRVTGTLPPGRKPAHRAALAWMVSSAPMRDEFLAYDGSGGAGPAPDAKVRSVRRLRSSGELPDIVAEVEVSAPSTFVFRESWHPRFTGLIDGQVAPVRRLTPNFPALDVPAGDHTIALRFDRPWWALAAWLLWPALALLGSVAARRRYRSPSLDNAP